MDLWVCDCEDKCACGVCPGVTDDGKGCECECHMLDGLSDTQVMQLLVDHGGKFIADVINKNRNQLFKMMATEGFGEIMLKEGVKVLQRSMSEARERPLDILEKIAQQVSAVSRGGARTPSPKTVSKARRLEARRKKTKNSKARKKTTAAAQKRKKQAARRLDDDDCDT